MFAASICIEGKPISHEKQKFTQMETLAVHAGRMAGHP